MATSVPKSGGFEAISPGAICLYTEQPSAHGDRPPDVTDVALVTAKLEELMNTYRRAILAAALVAASLNVARAADPVRVRMNWTFYGSHAGFFYGKAKGFFASRGIDLEILSGNGSTAAERLVANGDSTFAYGSCAAMISLASGGAPLISVAVIDAMGTDGVLVRPDSGVKSLADLSGKVLLTTANAGVNTFFPLVLKNAKVPIDSVHITNVAEGALLTGYLQGTGGAVGMLGGLDDKPSAIIAAGGAPPVEFAYSDYGINQVGYCISANTATVAKSPDLVKRFVAATVESYKATEADPKAAIDAMGQIAGGTVNDEKSKTEALAVLKVTLGVLYSKANTKHELGLNVPGDWSDMLDLMKTYNGLKTDQPATAFYTNNFLP
jgi:NitT/TauT family transport system substrate-binding protein